MKTLSMLFAGLVLWMSAALWAQAAPKAEVFGGGSFLRSEVPEGFTGDRKNPGGVQASAAFNIHRNVGLVADFGLQSKILPRQCPCDPGVVLGDV